VNALKVPFVAVASARVKSDVASLNWNVIVDVDPIPKGVDVIVTVGSPVDRHAVGAQCASGTPHRRQPPAFTDTDPAPEKPSVAVKVAV
jgi:hypothetical protein